MILPGTGRGTVRRRANGGGGSPLRQPGVYAARKLRRSLSPPEVVLWDRLRQSRRGFKVRRQHPIGPYVVDFYVGKAKLVIEVDGSAHDFGDRPERDAARDRYLAGQGFQMLRLLATDVIHNLEGVLMAISERAANPLRHLSDGPPPHDGEDFS